MNITVYLGSAEGNNAVYKNAAAELAQYKFPEALEEVKKILEV